MARRKKNPMGPGGKILLAAGAAVIAGIAYNEAIAKPAKKKKKKKDDKKLPTPDDEEKQTADELLNEISEDPAPSALYQIRKGDNFANLARAVFDAAGIPEAKNDGQARVAYMRCVSSSMYNRTLYGKKGDFTKNFPEWTSPDDISIRSAFLNKSADYITQLLNGNIPVKKGGSNYALLWLPGVDPAAWEQFGKIACYDLEPPPLAEAAEEG